MKTTVALPACCISDAIVFLINHWAIEIPMGYPKGLETLWKELGNIQAMLRDTDHDFTVTLDTEETESVGLRSICPHHWNLLRLAVERHLDEKTMSTMCDFEPKAKPYRMKSYEIYRSKYPLTKETK